MGETTPVLPTDSEERKQIPLFSGVLNYFPLALAAVARLSKRGNDKHNPGQPLHWARGKSTDHLDCIARHLIDVDTIAPSGEYEDAVAIAWRALAHLEELEEKRLGKPPSRGSRLEAPTPGPRRVRCIDAKGSSYLEEGCVYEVVGRGGSKEDPTYMLDSVHGWWRVSRFEPVP